LLPQVRRCADKQPTFAVTGDRDTGLSRGPYTRITRASQAALAASTIPLWKTTTCSRPKHDGNRLRLPIPLDQ
jgi:hypothetical protein